ncbi:hypothetical protein FG167_03590 [Lacinutrix sp. WUR7]|uniref:DUF6252 family protein n=1 Tax=Lacinutrix sp. WUR7 TaxID=2653681 RepID=UPI00193CD198|nr:DUF6252 family protein [Lacinutrix sp. WUR7]QRM88340.1 hypothetical protein FG167_03590 [Lacinutrix sp. WUR7]
MKKVFLFVVTALLMVSCGEELEFNTPALQGKKDGTLWRADYYSAEINSSGELIISGGRGSEIVTLRMGAAVGTYVLGEGSSSEAGFTSVQDIAYSTNNEPSEIILNYPADGEIVIEKYSASGSKVSGTFWFNAFSASGLNKVNYSQGVFYEVPISGGGGSTVVSCDGAVIASQAALTIYEATNNTSSEYPPACNAYKAALMQQITSCGDDTNTLQDIIDGLDCTLPCDVATANTDAAFAIYDVTDSSSADFASVCNAYKTTLEQQIESCGDDSSELQDIIDDLDCVEEVVIPGGCQTCSITSFPDTEYCDNGNGTMTVSVSGAPDTTIDIPGDSFNDYILALESAGYSCN